MLTTFQAVFCKYSLYNFEISRDNCVITQGICFKTILNQNTTHAGVLTMREVDLHARINPMANRANSIKRKVLLLFELNNIPFRAKLVRESRITTNCITQVTAARSCFKLLCARFE